MSNSTRIDLNGYPMSALVLVTDYGYRVNVDGRKADRCGAYDGATVTLGIQGEVVGRYQVTSAYPVPPSVWLALREVPPVR